VLLPVSAGKKFIQRSDTCSTLRSKRSDLFAKLLVWDRNNLQRMQGDRDVLDLEVWIEPCIGNVPKPHFTNQRNDDAATVVVKQSRLGKNHERNTGFQPAEFAVDVELRHQSVEYSSAILPLRSAKPFHKVTLARAFSTIPARRYRMSSSWRACAGTRGGVVLHSIHGPRDE
jgi:hypothetical protein